MYKTADIFFTEYDIDTDHSILPIEDKTNSKHPIYETKSYREQVIQGQLENYADFYIRRSYFSSKIERSYVKLDEVISYIGGFAEAFLIFLALFSNLPQLIFHYYNECLYSVALANKLFDFDVGNQPQNKKTPTSRNRGSEQYNVENSLKNNVYNPIQQSNENNRNKKNSKLNTPSKGITFFKFKNELNIVIDDNCTSNNNKTNQISKTNETINYSNQLNFLYQFNYIGGLEEKIPFGENDDSEVLYRKNLFNASHRKLSLKPRQLENLKILKRQSLKKIVQQKNNSCVDQGSQLSENSQEKEDYSGNNSKGKVRQLHLKKKIRRSNLNSRKNNTSILSSSIINSIPKIETSNLNEQTNFPTSNNLRVINPSIFSPLASSSSKLNHSERKLFTAPRQSLFSPKEFEINPLFGTQNINKYQNSSETTFTQPSLMQNESEQPLQMNENQTKKEQQPKNLTLQIPFQDINSNNNEEDLPLEGSQQVKEQDTQQKATNRVINFKKSMERLQYLKTEFKAILNKKAQIKMTFSYVIFKLSCQKLCRSKNNLLIEKSKELLEQELDIFVILEKLKEVSKFKELFLDKEQQILFNFFPKPIIKIEEEENFQLSKGSLLQLHANTPSNNNNKNKTIGNVTSPHNQINLKTIGIFAQAIHKLKQGVKQRHHVPSTMYAYKKLYDCYVICKKDKNIINKKLIGMLGREINSIFLKSSEISAHPDQSRLNSVRPSLKGEAFNFNHQDQVIENSQDQQEVNNINLSEQAKIVNRRIITQSVQDENNDWIKKELDSSLKVNMDNLSRKQNELVLEIDKENTTQEKESTQRNELFLSQQSRDYQGLLFSKIGFLRSKLESVDTQKDIKGFGDSIFSSTNKNNNEQILNSAFRRKDIFEKDPEKKISFKQSNSLKGSEEDEEYSDKIIYKYENDEESSDQEQNIQIDTCKTEVYEEDDNIIKKQNYRFTEKHTIPNHNTQLHNQKSQNTNHNTLINNDNYSSNNDNCLAHRGYTYSNNVSNNYSQFVRNNQTKQLSILPTEDIFQINQRKNSNFDTNYSLPQSSPFINLLSNKSIQEIDSQQIQLDIDSQRSQEKTIGSSARKKKSILNTTSKFKKNAKIRFYESQSSKYYQDKTNNDDDNQNQIVYTDSFLKQDAH